MLPRDLVNPIPPRPRRRVEFGDALAAIGTITGKPVDLGTVRCRRHAKGLLTTGAVPAENKPKRSALPAALGRIDDTGHLEISALACVEPGQGRINLGLEIIRNRIEDCRHPAKLTRFSHKRHSLQPTCHSSGETKLSQKSCGESHLAANSVSPTALTRKSSAST